MSRRWWTLVAVSLATFMTYLDNNVTNVAIPTIQRSLHLSVGRAGVGGQQLHPGVRRAAAGRRPAGRPVRAAAAVPDRPVGLHARPRSAAGLAGSGAVLIGARLVQGLGAALVVPTTLAIIMATFHDRQGAHHGHRHLDRDRRDGAGLRPADRRLHQPAPALGLDLLHQRAGRRRSPRRIALFAIAESRDPSDRPASGRARPDQLGGRAVRADLRADRGPRQGLDVTAHPRRVRAGRGGRGARSR